MQFDRASKKAGKRPQEARKKCGHILEGTQAERHAEGRAEATEAHRRRHRPQAAGQSADHRHGYARERTRYQTGNDYAEIGRSLQATARRAERNLDSHFLKPETWKLRFPFPETRNPKIQSPESEIWAFYCATLPTKSPLGIKIYWASIFRVCASSTKRGLK